MVNASRKAVDLAHLRRHLPNYDVRLLDDQALLALQGPAAADCARQAGSCQQADALHDQRDACGWAISTAPFRAAATLARTASRSPAALKTPRNWRGLLLAEPEVAPAGLGARDTLRLEAGLCLWGNDIDETTTPVEAGLGWAIGKRRREQGGFPGDEVVLRQLFAGPERRRVGIRLAGKAPARAGTPIHDSTGEPVGIVTSGGYAPSLAAPIAMGYVASPLCRLARRYHYRCVARLWTARSFACPLSRTVMSNKARRETEPMSDRPVQPGARMDSRRGRYRRCRHHRLCASSQLGDVVFVELPAIGSMLTKGDQAAVVESVKAASEVYAPVSGEVVAVNEALADEPGQVNAGPMAEGWFLKIRLSDESELETLMDESGLWRVGSEPELMRYLPLTEDDRRQMLAAIGVDDVDDLFRDVPPDALLTRPVDLPHHADEITVERTFRRLRGQEPLAGFGAVLSRCGSVPASHSRRCRPPDPAWRISHRVHAVSAGDRAGHAAVSLRISDPGRADHRHGGRERVALRRCHGMRRSNVDGLPADQAQAGGAVGRAASALARHRRDLCALPCDRRRGVAAVVGWRRAPGRSSRQRYRVCRRSESGRLRTRPRLTSALAKACRAKGALLVVAVAEVVSLGLLVSPGDMGADIVAAEGQSLGNALSFGGPTVGLLAARERFLRQMPGRLVGETVDQDGRRGFVLTLSTREQHIRREKATSNICTNSGLCALAFTIHLTMLGEAGFSRLAAVNHERACALADQLAAVPDTAVINRTFFNELTLRLPRPAADVVEALAARGILGGVPLSRLLPAWAEAQPLLLIAATELTTDADMVALATALTEVLR